MATPYKKLVNGIWLTLLAPAHFDEELLKRHLHDRLGVDITSDRIELRNVGHNVRFVVSFSMEHVAKILTKLGSDPAEPMIFRTLPPKHDSFVPQFNKLRDTTEYVDLVWPPKDVEAR